MERSSGHSDTRTLRIRRPLGRTLFMAAAILILFIGMCESIARLDSLRAYLPPQSINSGNQQIDVKLAHLDALIHRKERLDCIFLGSSAVDRGFDPEVFQDAYKNRAGKEIVCFNFGIAGCAEPSAALLSQALIRKYRPTLLIVGTTPLMKDQMQTRLVSNPWLRYWSGSFDFDGWLTEYSAAFRCYLGFRSLLKPAFLTNHWRLKSQVTANGYHPYENDTPDEKNLRPRRKTSPGTQDEPSGIPPETLDALTQITQQRVQTRVLFVEMPMHPSSKFISGKRREDYEEALLMTQDITQRLGAQFWRALPFHPVPDTGWKRRLHMNRIGAEAFSRWLGEKVGEAVSNGTL